MNICIIVYVSILNKLFENVLHVRFSMINMMYFHEISPPHLPYVYTAYIYIYIYGVEGVVMSQRNICACIYMEWEISGELRHDYYFNIGYIEKRYIKASFIYIVYTHIRHIKVHANGVYYAEKRYINYGLWYHLATGSRHVRCHLWIVTMLACLLGN